MTPPAGSKSAHRPVLSSIWLYLLFGVLILGLLVWTSLRTLQETPTRQASAQVPGHGWVTLTLTISPYPPVTDEPVLLNVVAENERDVLLEFIDGLPYTFGQQNSDVILGAGRAFLAADGAGYQSRLTFPSPGSYWVDYEILPGTKIRFQFAVSTAPTG
ncbi:MAG: hypothetical protein GX495_10605 [Chloroflexi bacterium]|jgi:hypothetical protein|nr:hypothetical protein [Chloroflexota bacterium]